MRSTFCYCKYNFIILIMKKTFAYACAVIMFSTAVVTPVQAKAQTIEDLRAQIAALLAQVQTLQKMIQETTSGQPFCYAWNSNLRVGMKGESVSLLQEALRREGFVVEDARGEFGRTTEGAVSRFQEKYQSEVLAPFNLTQGTGFVGIATRKKLNVLYECAPELQKIELSVATDKSTYTQGEDIRITLSAHNTSSAPATLDFTSGCQTAYTIAGFHSLAAKLCLQALTSVTIPAMGTYTWEMIHSPAEFMIPAGTRILQGQVVGYDSAQTTITITE